MFASEDVFLSKAGRGAASHLDYLYKKYLHVLKPTSFFSLPAFQISELFIIEVKSVKRIKLAEINSI